MSLQLELHDFEVVSTTGSVEFVLPHYFVMLSDNEIVFAQQSKHNASMIIACGRKSNLSDIEFLTADHRVMYLSTNDFVLPGGEISPHNFGHSVFFTKNKLEIASNLIISVAKLMFRNYSYMT